MRVWPHIGALAALSAALLAGCFLSHERSEPMVDGGAVAADAGGGARDAGRPADLDASIDAAIDAGTDAAFECRDHSLDRSIVDLTVDRCARTGDRWSSPPVEDCACDSDCATGGCGREVCFDRRQPEGAGPCDCGGPVSAACGCVRGRCAWYDLRDPTAACAAPGEGCVDRRCCPGGICNLGLCHPGT